MLHREMKKGNSFSIHMSYFMFDIAGSTLISLFSLFYFQHTIEYSIIGNVPAPYYFEIDRFTGQISIRNSLSIGSDTVYTVSIYNGYFVAYIT